MAELTCYCDLPPDQLVALLSAASEQNEQIRIVSNGENGGTSEFHVEIGKIYISRRYSSHPVRGTGAFAKSFIGTVSRDDTGSMLRGGFKLNAGVIFAVYFCILPLTVLMVLNFIQAVSAARAGYGDSGAMTGALCAFIFPARLNRGFREVPGKS